MSPEEFHRHLGRLTEQFGKSAYSQARAELIWREVKDFSAYWWEKTVDKFLLSERQVPLMKELSEEIGVERQRLYKLMQDQQPDPKMQSMHIVCSNCHGVGIILNQQNYVYLCYCAAGRRRSEKYPIWNKRGNI